jgi:hypothetical protein
MYKWMIVLCVTLAGAVPPSAQAHDGPLDIFGCHHDQNGKYYHCHEGAYKRLSFDSKTQMIQRLRNQHIALGRTWPYGEETSPTEQPSAIRETTLEPAVFSSPELKQTRQNNRVQSNHLTQHTSLKEVAKATTQAHPKPETSEAKKAAPASSEVRRKRTEPELKVWVTQIRADGRPIFESKEGERFFLDDSGTKVLIGRRDF